MNPVSTNRETTFDLLSNDVRREIITALHESGSVPRSHLTDRLASATVEGEADADARRRLRIALHHNHLPRLADAGVVVYDDETVTATNQLEALASEISRFEQSDRAVAWS